MSPLAVILTMLGWFALTVGVSLWASRGKGSAADFFNGGRKAPRWLVTLAMIGAPMSGVTFVSVPGMVGVDGSAMSYMEMVLGFFAGYLVIAYVLIPVFFRSNTVSIYQYLDNRFGVTSHRTGAWLFFISKILGASVRLFLVCGTLQLLVFDPLGLPFWLNALTCMLVTLAYTWKGGMKSVLWTDALKTVCMTVAVVLCMVFIAGSLGLDARGAARSVRESGMGRIFFLDDPLHPKYFWKQFFAGMFTVIAMTGLDQDLMQRTLSSRNAADSRRSLITGGLLQIPVIFLFLCLGAMLYLFAGANGIAASGDSIFPEIATGGLLPSSVGVLFVLGLVSCAFSAGASALTALTTSFTADIIGTGGKDEKSLSGTRKTVHLCMALLMGLCILAFRWFGTGSVIDAVYKLASYTYGPILGMFAFGLACRRRVRDRWVPLVAVLAPVLSYIVQAHSGQWLGGYRFGYELILLNALLTVLGLCLLIRKDSGTAV